MADNEQKFGPFGQYTGDSDDIRDSLETTLQQGYRSYAHANEESLQSVWGRLDAHLQQSQQKTNVVPIETVRKRYERKPSMGEIASEYKKTGRWSRLARTLSSIAAVLVVAFLVGSSFLLFKTSGKIDTYTGLGSATPPPASPGIYMTTDKDISTVAVSKVDPVTHAVVWEHADAKARAFGLTVYGDTVYYSASNETYGDPQYQEKYVIALNANTGAVRWKAEFGKSLVPGSNGSSESDLGYLSQPTVADGLVYVLARNGKVTALDASNGKVSWTHDSGASALVDGTIYDNPQLVVGNGIVYGSLHNKLFALQAKDGKEAWKPVQIEQEQTFNNLELLDGVLYASSSKLSAHTAVSSWDSYVGAYDAKNGREQWRKHFRWLSDLVLIAGGKVYVTEREFDNNMTQRTKLHVLDIKGQELWNKAFDVGRSMGGLTAEKDLVYISSGTYNETNGQITSYKLSALNADKGNEVWSIDAIADPSQVKQGILYTTYYTGSVKAYNATNGEELWNAQYGAVLKDKMGNESARLYELVVIP